MRGCRYEPSFEVAEAQAYRRDDELTVDMSDCAAVRPLRQANSAKLER